MGRPRCQGPSLYSLAGGAEDDADALPTGDAATSPKEGTKHVGGPTHLDLSTYTSARQKNMNAIDTSSSNVARDVSPPARLYPGACSYELPALACAFLGPS